MKQHEANDRLLDQISILIYNMCDNKKDQNEVLPFAIFSFSPTLLEKPSVSQNVLLLLRQ